jgi:hypothetical protein
VNGCQSGIVNQATLRGHLANARNRQAKFKTEAAMDLAAALGSTTSKVIPAPRYAESDLLACYVMGDPHFGMYAWAEETGADFDLKIAERLTKSAVDNLVSRAPRAHSALLIVLGDLIHSDTKQNRTEASGHPLDVDTRWSRVMGVALRTLVYSIAALLRHHRRVTVRLCEGNHDPQAAFSIALALSEHFRRESRVRLDLSPANYWFYGFGANVIGATHGHRCKTAKLPSIMAASVPKLWGGAVTNGRAFYQGHLHNTETKEHNGCVTHVMRTLAAPDAYAAGAGYISGRSMALDIYDRRDGFLTRHICTSERAGRKNGRHR